jgi:hypothetical protein
MCLVTSHFFVPDGPHYVSLNPDRIDVSQLKKWLANCEANHREHCHERLTSHIAHTVSSVTFIDVQHSCLVIPTTTPVRYVALSYVWGDIPGSLMATTQNVGHLFSLGSLEAPTTNSRIPRTILDAISFTKIMGVRYLWVDRLCIVQDDSRHFNSQLQQMASIYANSCFTIIAADGQDANHGLRGIPSPALRRVYEQTYLDLPSNVKLLQWESPPEDWSNMPHWYTRAWTFQERAVSRKTIIFVNGTVYWQCRSATWYEACWVKDRDDEVSADWPAHALILRPWPDLAQYFDLVCGYNSRSLSFESDALRAFTAIMSALNSSFPNGFLFGVPELLFDIGLLWSRLKPLKRRKGFPSWSWVGWSGEIHFIVGAYAWTPDAEYPFKLQMFPVVEWKKVQIQRQAQLRIDNSYHLYQQMALDPETVLPEGWTRSTEFSEDKHGSDFSKHFAHPSIKGQRFRYPFPVMTHTASLNLDLYSPILPFRAQKCTMILGSPLEKDINCYGGAGLCLTVELNDSAGLRTGLIESSFVGQHEYEKGDPCELMAISKGSLRKEEPTGYPGRKLLQEVNTFSELKDKEYYEFYNVLWIEWEDGIAYRKALGRVMKEAWERQNFEEADILLG